MKKSLLFLLSLLFLYSCGTAEDPMVVDLGLSVKWAACNVGAANLDETGNYYAWGEVLQKDTYSLQTYKFTDNEAVLTPLHDVAHVVMGEDWRMPTKDEWGELIDGCDWERVNLDGAFGYAGTSKKNGNVIFFPMAGLKLDDSHDFNRFVGYYWTSSMSEVEPSYACQVRLNSNGFISTIDSDRFVGLCVRAVKP